MNTSMRRFGLAALMLAAWVGCEKPAPPGGPAPGEPSISGRGFHGGTGEPAAAPPPQEPPPPDALYFESPRQAVDAITGLLKARDWPSLARYYDLRGSGIDRAALASGEYFYTDVRPESAHPAGFWHYKHPFAPGFQYYKEIATEDPNVTSVLVMVQIDQGAGPPQRGLNEFEMVRGPRGWQVLPAK